MLAFPGPPALPLPSPACSGPVSEILPFFESHLDFVCPVMKDAGSFLQVRLRLQYSRVLQVLLVARWCRNRAGTRPSTAA